MSEIINNIEKEVMNRKAFGIVGVGSINSNFNADFTGNPKRYLNEYVASPFAIKFAIRAYMERKGCKVFFKKGYKFLPVDPNAKKGKGKGKPKKQAETEVVSDENKEDTSINRILPLSLEEKYYQLYSVEKLPKDEIEFQNNVFSAMDVMNFGGTFPIAGLNSGYTGVVQFNTAINKYDEAETIRDTMGTQFQNANQETAESSSLGSRSILSEGHFFYAFTVDPYVLNFVKKYNKEFTGYTKEAYETFKEASLYSVSNLNSVSKMGCFNEFALFVELKEEALTMLTNINNNVKFEKKDGKNIIDLALVMGQLEAIKDDIHSIEVYYNPITTKVELGSYSVNQMVKGFNLLNRVEITKEQPNEEV